MRQEFYSGPCSQTTAVLSPFHRSDALLFDHIQQLESPCPLIRPFVGWRQICRIVYCRYVYDATIINIITHVRCSHQDDDHQHPCTMRLSSWWSSAYDAVIMTMMIIIRVRCSLHSDDRHHPCMMQSSWWWWSSSSAWDDHRPSV